MPIRPIKQQILKIKSKFTINFFNQAHLKIENSKYQTCIMKFRIRVLEVNQLQSQ